ncbi:MAG: hypothetical protein RPU34_11595, partial [Candidatus Sedimenticola sp. (ex Thyasira tokunagai)]
GCTELVIPDNLRSAVSKACRYDPQLNPSYQQLAEHYQLAVIPARPYIKTHRYCMFSPFL